MKRGLIIIPFIFAVLVFSIEFNKSTGEIQGPIVKTASVSVNENRDVVKYLSDGAIYPVKTFVVGGYNLSAVRLRADFMPTDEEIVQLVDILSKAKISDKLISETIFVFPAGSDLSKRIFLKHGEYISAFNLKKEDHAGKKGLYFRATGGVPIVVIKNLNQNNEDNVGTVLHELGHRIADELTDIEWGNYYKLRLIPEETPRYKEEWELSPNEDFAEVYRYLAVKHWLNQNPENIKTRYGKLIPVEEDRVCNSIKEEARLQDCRSYVFGHPEIYPPDKYQYTDKNELQLLLFFNNILGRL